MKKASLISFVLLLIMAGQAVGDAWWWPPTGAAMVTPQNPTSSDVVAVTFSGEWPHSCTPNDSAILVMGNDIYFDVILDYPPGACLTVITPWQRTESVGPLPPGTYTVYARLVGDPFVPEIYVPMAEITVTGIYYVDADANGANDGSSWVDAFNHLQDALAVAIYGDEIQVAEGVYKPDEDSNHPDGTGNREATFQLIDGVAVRGGYAGSGEPEPNARDFNAYETVLSGDLNGDDAEVSDPLDMLYDPKRSENSYIVVTGNYTDQTAALDGFSITNGVGLGGITNGNGSPTITNCRCSKNVGLSGGGMCNWRGSPRVKACTFSENFDPFAVPINPKPIFQLSNHSQF